MIAPTVHPFLALALSDRSRWIAMFCDRAPSPPAGMSLDFPLLPRSETPLSWLEDQFRRAETAAGKADRFREAVVDLLRRELDGLEFRNRTQVLGTLVDLASACGFTEIGPKLRDWIRGDHLSDAAYIVDGHSIPLRQTLWSAVIAWGLSEGMHRYLQRDLGRPELQCAALCFSALGRLSPADAIAEIPTICTLPLPYRDEVLRGFFENFTDAARTLVKPELLPAWERCLGELRWNPEISEVFQPYLGAFLRLLAAAGLALSQRPGEEKFELQPVERAFEGLVVDLEPFMQQVDERLLVYFEGLVAGDSMPFPSGAALAHGTAGQAARD
jgi:hypothetical protein